MPVGASFPEMKVHRKELIYWNFLLECSSRRPKRLQETNSDKNLLPIEVDKTKGSYIDT